MSFTDQAEASVEDIVYSLVSGGASEGGSFVALARKYREGLLSEAEMISFDDAYRASMKIRSSVVESVYKVIETLNLTDEQEDAIIAAVRDDNVVEQSRPARMIPSKRLLKAFDTALGTLSRVVGTALRHEALWDDVRSVLVTEARILREEKPIVAALTEDGRFLDIVASQIADRLLIDPVGSDEFLVLLVQEIVGFLSSGNVFEGEWGAVVVDGGELVYKLTARKKVSYEASRKKILEVEL
jgi:hypothetical protein